jgi:hypothetical protein
LRRFASQARRCDIAAIAAKPLLARRVAGAPKSARHNIPQLNRSRGD